MLVNKINGPFNPKYEKLHLRAYLLGTVSDVEIEKKWQKFHKRQLQYKVHLRYKNDQLCYIMGQNDGHSLGDYVFRDKNLWGPLPGSVKGYFWAKIGQKMDISV